MKIRGDDGGTLFRVKAKSGDAFGDYVKLTLDRDYFGVSGDIVEGIAQMADEVAFDGKEPSIILTDDEAERLARALLKAIDR